MPVAAAAVPDFRKLRRVVMRFPPWLLFAGAVCHRHAVLVSGYDSAATAGRRGGKIVGQATGREQDGKTHLKRDDFSSNRLPALSLYLSMIFFGKPVPTFPDHALTRFWRRNPAPLTPDSIP